MAIISAARGLPATWSRRKNADRRGRSGHPESRRRSASVDLASVDNADIVSRISDGQQAAIRLSKGREGVPDTLSFRCLQSPCLFRASTGAPSYWMWPKGTTYTPHEAGTGTLTTCLAPSRLLNTAAHCPKHWGKSRASGRRGGARGTPDTRAGHRLQGTGLLQLQFVPSAPSTQTS